MAKFCTDVFSFSMDAAVVSSTMAKASAVFPLLSAIASMDSVKSSACCVIVAAAFAASWLLNISAIDFPDESAASWMICKTSVRLMPESINSLKLFPVLFFRISLAVLPLFPSSFSIPLM